MLNMCLKMVLLLIFWQQDLNEVIIPTTNVDRRLSDGSRHKEENVNKSQIYMNFFGQKFINLCA